MLRNHCGAERPFYVNFLTINDKVRRKQQIHSMKYDTNSKQSLMITTIELLDPRRNKAAGAIAETQPAYLKKCLTALHFSFIKSKRVDINTHVI